MKCMLQASKSRTREPRFENELGALSSLVMLTEPAGLFADPATFNILGPFSGHSGCPDRARARPQILSWPARLLRYYDLARPRLARAMKILGPGPAIPEFKTKFPQLIAPSVVCFS